MAHATAQRPQKGTAREQKHSIGCHYFPKTGPRQPSGGRRRSLGIGRQLGLRLTNGFDAERNRAES